MPTADPVFTQETCCYSVDLTAQRSSIHRGGKSMEAAVLVYNIGEAQVTPALAQELCNASNPLLLLRDKRAGWKGQP